MMHTLIKKSSKDLMICFPNIKNGLWGEQDSNLRRLPNGFTVRPRWPLEYLPDLYFC